MVKDLIIRPYNSSDQESWLKCRLVSFHDSAYYDDVYTKKPIFDNPSLELVAEIDGNIIGVLDLEKDNKGGSICYCKSGSGAMVWTIAVLPDYRRYGIASQLILNGEFDLVADINLDSTVNVLDVIQLVNIILSN